MEEGESAITDDLVLYFTKQLNQEEIHIQKGRIYIAREHFYCLVFIHHHGYSHVYRSKAKEKNRK